MLQQIRAIVLPKSERNNHGSSKSADNNTSKSALQLPKSQQNETISAIIENAESVHLPDISLCCCSAEEVKHLESVIVRLRQYYNKENERRRSLNQTINAVLDTKPLMSIGDKDFFCIVCASKLNYLLNPSETCEHCFRDMCRKCTCLFNSGLVKLCTLCYHKYIYSCQNGDWFSTELKSNGKNCQPSYSLDILHSSLSKCKTTGSSWDVLALTHNEFLAQSNQNQTVASIQIGLSYDDYSQTLLVHIIQCRNIDHITRRKYSHLFLYVRTYLLPHQSSTCKCRTQNLVTTNSPIFNEVLQYNVTKEALKNRILWINLWHYSTMRENAFLGECLVPVVCNNLTSQRPGWHVLQIKEQLPYLYRNIAGKQKLSLALLCNMRENTDTLQEGVLSNALNSSTLFVWIKEIENNVEAIENNKLECTFCKLCLHPRGTNFTTKFGSNNADSSSCNDCVVKFEGIEEDWTQCSVEITVWTKNIDNCKPPNKEFIGGLRLNFGLGIHNGNHVHWMDATKQEADMWQEMVNYPNHWVNRTLPLRPCMI